MSSEHCFFAERWNGKGWDLLGNLVPTRYDGPPRPHEPVEVGEHDELMTVLSGHYSYLGSYHHSGLSILAQPRGFPEDVSPSLADWAESRADLVFRPSWLKAKEVQDFDWDSRNLLLTGYVHASKATLFKMEDPSAPFPEAAWPGARERPCCHPEHLASFKDQKPEDLLYNWRFEGAVEVFWTESHREYLGQSLETFLSQLSNLGPPDQIRLVFWTEA